MIILIKRVCTIIILLEFSCLIPDLIRILDQFVRCMINTFELFGQFYCAGLYRSQVKTHFQVGCARTTLHVEHLHFMCGVITENMDSFPIHNFSHKELVDFIFIQPACTVITFEDFIKRCLGAVAIYFACPEVDRTANGAVNATQIQHQFAVNIEPEVIVAGELEDDVVSPVIYAIRCLSEYGGKLHAVVIVGIILWNRVQWLSLARVGIREFLSFNIVLVSDYITLGIMGVTDDFVDIVIGHELTMCPGRSCIGSDCTDLIVDSKVSGFISL